MESDASGIQHLSVGQCFNMPNSEVPTGATRLLSDTKVVNCAELHNAEVVAAFDYPLSAASAEYPGHDPVSSYAGAECGIRFERYVGIPFQRSSYGLVYVPPMEFNWDAGDRSVKYLVQPPDGKSGMTGSVRDSRR